MMFGFFTLLGLSGVAEAKAPLEYVDGLYLGVGMQYQKLDDESDTPLAFDIRYAPAWPSSLRPYGRFIWTSAARPTDEVRDSLEEFGDWGGGFSDEDIPSWRLNVLDFQLGVEMDIPSELFVRTGIAGIYSSEAGMGPAVVEDLSIAMDFSTVTRAGVFAAAGKRLDLDSMQLETSLNLTHVRGLTVGGEDTTIGDCPDGDLAWEELCDRSRSDFANSITRLAVDNHMYIGPVAMAAAVFYGKVHSSKYIKELAEEWGDTSGLNPSFYGAHLTVGYEFGAGEREPRVAKTKRAPTAAIQMTGIKEFDELFMQAKAIQDRVVALRMKLAEGRAAFADALGASPDTDLSILADQARGSLMSSISVSMAGGVPSFSAGADAPPEAKQAAAGLSTMAQTAEETTKEMAKLKDDVMALINDAQAFPGQAPSAAQAALKDGSIKFMDVPKIPKKVIGNVKEMSGLPQEIGGLAKDAASTTAVLGRMAGG